ncbi:MAG TPA: hypothetical protein VLA78_10945 [Paracoccaceae bacterium]|jgi:hypothetical protein|nr:hypothetical protein [Paracoccaceae bacterium]
MATTTTNIQDRSGILAALRRVLSAVWSGMVFLNEIGPMREELERLSRKSDADLEAEGKTRHGEISRIFGPRMAL